MKRGGVNGMFPSPKRDINEWGSRYEPKNNCCSCNLGKRTTVQFINILTSEFFGYYSCKIIVMQ